MAEIIIRKKVTLEFLGDEYKDAYLEFRSVPVDDYPELLAQTKNEDEESSLAITIGTLKKYFLKGSFPDSNGQPQELTKDDIGQFDQQVLLHAFGALTGQTLDPKENSNSTTPSTTEQEPPSSS